MRRPGTEPQRRSVVVYFDGDVLKTIEAPELPSEREFVASISRCQGPARTKLELELTEEQRNALPPPRKQRGAAAGAGGPGARLSAARAGMNTGRPDRRSNVAVAGGRSC